MKVPAHADDTQAREVLASLSKTDVNRYQKYFDTLMPESHTVMFQRALFAFASVHTTWQSNVKMYAMLQGLTWLEDRKELMLRITESRAGLHVNRCKYIWEFSQKFWANPDWYWKQEYEDWFQYRDRIDKNTLGLGLAKSAFFIELTYLHKAQVPCFDVHMIKLFGLPNKKYAKSGASAPFMKWCEARWVHLCHDIGMSPVTARWLYWDQKQGKTDSRYWSHVLEGPLTDPLQSEPLLFPQEDMVELVEIPKEGAKKRVA